MVHFVVGTQVLKGQKEQTKSKLSNGVGSYGENPHELKLDLDKFKLGNLDNMMINYELVQKQENAVESILKKIEKAHHEIDPNNNIKK